MKNNSDVYKDYLLDLSFLIKEYAQEAKTKKEASEFYKGYLSCFHRIISLMQQQANAFDIPLSEINLEDIDPERDLI